MWQSGNLPDVIFEVTTQKNNGPVIHTRNYQLIDDVIVTGPSETGPKLHSFKNYKCAAHDTFFPVNLHAPKGTAVYNEHHMRLYTFTRRNDALLLEILGQWDSTIHREINSSL